MNKNKITTIGIVVTTIVLAAVAIFTAIRLYQTRNQPVAPNVPSSKPAAYDNSCTVTFTITSAPQGVVCNKKEAYRDSSTNTAGNYKMDATTAIAAGGSVSKGEKVVFKITTKPGGTATNPITKVIVVTDTVPGGFNFLDSTSNCSHDKITRVVTCNGTSTQDVFAIRLQVSTNVVATTLSNQAVVTGQGDTPSNCSTSLALVTGPTTTPTTTATSTSTSTATSTSTSTSTGTSRATATSTTTASPVPQCNNSCTSNSNCPSGMMCYITSGATTGSCRNTQCLSETDCICPVITASPAPTTQASLPVVGTSWPTLLGTGFGILVIIGSLLLAL